MAMIPDTILVWLNEDPILREKLVERLRALPIVQAYNPELKSFGSKDAYRTLASSEQYTALTAARMAPSYIPLCPAAGYPELTAFARAMAEECGREVVGLARRMRPATGTAYIQLQINTETLRVVGVHVMSDSTPTTTTKVSFVQLEEVTAPTTIFSCNGYAEAADQAQARLLAYPWLWRLLTPEQVKRADVAYAAMAVDGPTPPGWAELVADPNPPKQHGF